VTEIERAEIADAVITCVEIALMPVCTKLAETIARMEEHRDRLRDVDTLRARVAAVEARPAVPGPPGVDGAPGRDGLDGIGFEDLDVAIEGRTLTLRFVGGARDRSFSVDLPVPRYCGVFTEGATYTLGDVVTCGGSAWIARADTTIARPMDGSPAWQLMVKRGADGRHKA